MLSCIIGSAERPARAGRMAGAVYAAETEKSESIIPLRVRGRCRGSSDSEPEEISQDEGPILFLLSSAHARAAEV